MPPPRSAARLHPPATVAIGFVTGMLSGLLARGIDPAPMLQEAGLEAAALRDPQARVLLTRYAALYNGIARTLNDEGLALFSVPLRTGMVEFLCRSMIGSRTLGESLARASSFLALVLPDLVLSVRKDGNSAHLQIREAIPLGPVPHDPRRVFAYEWLLRLIHGLSCWLVGRGLSLDSVNFPYPPPPQASDYASIYTEQAHFGGALLEARMRANLLDLPVTRDLDAVAGFLDGAPGKITMLYRRDREMVRRVRDILAAALPEPVSLATVAARLHLTERTVQRRLHQEGSSFRAVKTALRRDLALSKIEKSRRSIAALALDLGYTEPSAFFRAFVEWTGEAPSAYRKRLLG